MHATLKRLYECAGIDPAQDGPTRLANKIGESPAVISNWNRRGVSQEGAIRAQRQFGWSSAYILDGVKPRDSAVAPTETTSIFSRKQREDDNVTAVRIALRSLAQVLLARSPGAAEEFLKMIEANCKKPPFSPDHFLLGSLADIAEAIRDDEEAGNAAPRRANSVRRTKRDT